MTNEHDDPTVDPTATFMGMLDAMAPMLEACAGMKAQIINHGMTDETAEAIVREIMITTIRRAMNPPRTSWKDILLNPR